jgi:hypothetical protein
VAVAAGVGGVVAGSDVAGAHGAGEGVVDGGVFPGGGSVLQPSVEVLKVLLLLLLDGVVGVYCTCSVIKYIVM